MSLPDMEPYEFAVFVHWMYTGEIDKEGSGFERPVGGHFGGAFAAFLAGDVLDNESLRNEAMTEMIKIDNDMKTLPGEPGFFRYWDKTAESSPLRRYLVNSYASYASVDSLAGLITRVPSNFLQEILRKLAQIRDATKKEVITPATACKYHDHKETPTCTQT